VEDFRSNAITYASDAYLSAMEMSTQLPSPSLLRLGVCLNFSVFLFEIQNDTEGACKVAADAFEQTVGLVTDATNHKRESTIILQLLRDNLSLWQFREERVE